MTSLIEICKEEKARISNLVYVPLTYFSLLATVAQ